MKAKIRVSVKKIMLSAASLSVSVINFSQNCPINAGDYKLNTQSAAEANIVKRTESGGVTYNRLWCPYKAAGQPDISFYVNWVTNVPNNKFKYTWTCMSIVSSKDIINAGNKQAYATFGGYPVNDDYRRGLLKPLAEKILLEVYPHAAPCPLGLISDNSNNSNQDNADICRKNFEKLRQLLEKKSGINHELKTLQDNSFNEKAERDKLSRCNKFITMLNDPNYDTRMINNPNYQAKVDKELDRLYYDTAYRTQQAISYGLNPDATEIKIIRTIRDVAAARIDYFKDAPIFIQRQKNELAATETAIEKIHRENTQRQCPGDYDINSCDLDGEWIFTRWDTDIDNGTYKETWLFTPISKGRYSAVNQKTWQRGEAETYGRRVKFSIKLRPEYTITHIFLLNDVCNAGGGNTNLQGANPRLDVKRSEPVKKSYVQDKLYDISFNGNNYQGMYQREKDNGVLIDIFFFSINHITGYQIEQDGQKLWGRFVRKPATDHPDQSAVQWWFSNWVLQNGRWVKKDEKIATPPKIK